MALTMFLKMPRNKRPDTSLAANLVAVRKARGITQVQLAEMIGSSQRALSSYERGISYPSPPVLADLARALNTSADKLLGVTPLPRQEPAGDAEVRRLWKKFQRLLSLPEKDRRAVTRLVNSLVTLHGNR